MASDTPTSLAPGFRFHPTDEELVRYYLKRKVSGKKLRFDPIGVIDIYKTEPWDLPLKSKLKSRDLEWYFFSALDKKYGNSSRTNRATEKGYWKTTGKDRPVKHNSRIVGMKKTLVYHSGRAPRGTRTNWVMHEYKLVDEELVNAGIAQDAFVLCRVFQKSGTGPKNGEQYGAPFLEEEWEDDEMAALPGEEDRTDLVVVGDNDFVETKDLEQNLDTGMASESAGPPLNFYYGESSSYPNHSLEFSKEYQKPQSGAVETFEALNDQCLNLPEHYLMDSKLVEDEITGEANHEDNPLNFNYTLDGLYLDATDVLPVADASFLETNDLVNSLEAYPTGADRDEEYLSFFGNDDDDDDDVTRYISFDSPQMTSSENLVSEQIPVTQLNVDEGTNEATTESKHCGNEASSSEKKPEASEFVLGNKNSFIKQAASHLLGSIPAPSAYAAEFPSKEIALQLQSVAQSSSSAAHVSAGMIRITNLTLSGNGMDWTLSKNGEINVMLSSQADAPAALVRVPGLLSCKTAFVVSHGWIFLMLFSILILSLSFKIGSFMYTGK